MKRLKFRCLHIYSGGHHWGTDGGGVRRRCGKLPELLYKRDKNYNRYDSKRNYCILSTKFSTFANVSISLLYHLFHQRKFAISLDINVQFPTWLKFYICSQEAKIEIDSRPWKFAKEKKFKVISVMKQHTSGCGFFSNALFKDILLPILNELLPKLIYQHILRFCSEWPF